MKDTHEHITEAVTSMWSGLRHLHSVRRVLGKSPSTAKADSDFDTALEHFESVLDVLKEALLLPPASTPSPIIPPPVLSREPPVVEPQEPPSEASEADDERPDVKGGKPSLKDDLAHLLTATQEVLPHLEAMKRVRADQGRPMSAERLTQVDQFMGEMQGLLTRLSALKGEDAQQRQHDAEQQGLREMAERFKRLGVTA